MTHSSKNPPPEFIRLLSIIKDIIINNKQFQNLIKNINKYPGDGSMQAVKESYFVVTFYKQGKECQPHLIIEQADELYNGYVGDKYFDTVEELRRNANHALSLVNDNLEDEIERLETFGFAENLLNGQFNIPVSDIFEICLNKITVESFKEIVRRNKVDGQSLTPNEIRFMHFCQEKFDESKWLKKFKIIDLKTTYNEEKEFDIKWSKEIRLNLPTDWTEEKKPDTKPQKNNRPHSISWSF